VAIPNALTLTVVGWSGTLAITRYGDIAWSILGIGAGKSITAVSGSIQVGWLNQTRIPSESEVISFLRGHGINFGGGYIVGVSAQYSPEHGTATQIGLFSPQMGVSYNYAW